MAPMRRAYVYALSAALFTSAAGCQMFDNMFYELQPHRLWRLNRGPGMSSDAYYSVHDDVPTETGLQDAGAGREPTGK